MFAPRVFQFLVAQHGERAAHALAGFPRQEYVIHIAAAGGDERIGKFLLILVGAGFDLLRIPDVFAEDNFHRALRAHYRNLGTWPGKVHVTAQVFGGHHVIGTAISFAGDERHLRNRAFRVCV